MRLPWLLPLTFLPGALVAEAPRVATDIAPIHSLVSQVMAGVGAPELIVRPGASPHGYAMSPKQAASLEQADLVVWMGEALTPWLERSIDSLAGDAHHLALLELQGTTILAPRDIAVFEDDDHDHGHDDHKDHDDHADHNDHKDHDHDAHEEHAHEEGVHDHEEHAEDAHENHDDHDHDRGDSDPHAWLDPENAKVWLTAIAEELAELDAENADTYRANAAKASEALAAAATEIQAQLTKDNPHGYLVYHDAYQYFENRFGVPASGAISASDAASPGAARVAELRDLVQKKHIACVFHEPQYSPKLVNALTDGTELRNAPLDPLGSDLEPGAELYEAMLRQIGAQIADCL